MTIGDHVTVLVPYKLSFYYYYYYYETIRKYNKQKNS